MRSIVESIKHVDESYSIKDARKFIKDYEAMDYDDALDNAEEIIKGLAKSSDKKIQKIAQDALDVADEMDDLNDIGEHLINTIREIANS